MTDNGINKEVSACLYGVAALLMIFHHLFPLDISGYGYIPLIEIKGIPIEEYFSIFCKMCVAMYAFISGYALSKISKKRGKMTCCEHLYDNIKLVIRRISKLYCHVWLSWLVFIPAGIFIGFFRVDFKNLLLAFLGKATVYTPAWWYCGQYIKMLIIFCIFDLIICCIIDVAKVKSQMLIYGGFILIIIFCIQVKEFSFLSKVGGHISYTIIFWEAYFIAKYRIVEYIEVVTKTINYRFKRFFCSCIICIIITLRIVLANGDRGWENGDIFFTPFLILFVVTFLKTFRNDGKLRRILSIVGNSSTFIWLCHNFILVFFWNVFILLKYSFLIYVALSVVCMIVSKIMDRFFELSFKLMKKFMLFDCLKKLIK